MRINHKLKGFTLVELSIVIVVIGLIIGGVVAGKSLVEAAKLHSDISKFKEYKMAYSMFLEQYNAVPGDMKNATAYWPGLTADGNGNKIITTGGEDGYVFNQFTLAKVIGGNYIAWQFPKPYIAKARADYFLIAAPPVSIIADNTTTYVNAISIYSPTDGSIYNAVTPAQGLAIDTKIDDSIPTRGKINSFSVPTNDCIKQSDGSTNADWNYAGIGSYNIAQTAQQCGIAVWLHR